MERPYALPSFGLTSKGDKPSKLVRLRMRWEYETASSYEVQCELLYLPGCITLAHTVSFVQHCSSS